jgi:ribonuclease HI
MPAPADKVVLFTDGACSGNPGPGGWAYILKHPASGKSKRRSGAEADTTNNRMELRAVVEGLRALKSPCAVHLVTDSKYVAGGLSEWLKQWKARGWKTADRKPVKNVDLWEALDELAQTHAVQVEHVAGHAGHPENEECDRMAVEAYTALRSGG